MEEVLHSPKAKRRRVRKQKMGKAGLKTASLQYQLLLEQRKTKILEKRLQEVTPAPQREDLRTELNELFDTAGVEPQPQQGAGESQSLDISLWKLMFSLLQTRLTGDRVPLLKTMLLYVHRSEVAYLPERPWTAAKTIKSVKAVSSRHCAAAVSTAVLGQSHKDNVRRTAVEEQPQAKEVQLSQPSSCSVHKPQAF